jgi:integrase
MILAPFNMRAIEALPVTGKTYPAYDPALPGFGVRVAAGGTKSWTIEYRPGGGRRSATKRLTLGRVGTLSLVQARERAKTILAAVQLGADPAGDKIDRRGAVSVAEMAESYMSEEIRPLKKPRTVTLYAGYINNHVLPALGTRKARGVTPADVIKLHRKIGAGGAKVAANRTVALVSAAYTWAATAGLVPEGVNPARGVSRFKEESRERYLTPDEFARLGAAIREAETVGLPWDVDETVPNAKHLARPEKRREVVSPHAIAAILLLIFTGARLREILDLRWIDIDLDRGVLALPDSKTGKKTVLLTAPALAVLAMVPRCGEYVIAGLDPERPRSDLAKPWRAIVKHAGLTGLRLHDLRHSFASVGVSANFGLPIIGALLGHARSETTARYAHAATDPMRRAADTIAGTIAASLRRDDTETRT